MNLFTSAVEYYRRYRPGIPSEVVALLTDATPHHRPRRLLDIGTGTGLVVAALQEHVDDILAIDPDEDMLTAAEATLRPHTPQGVRLELQQCAAEELTLPAGWQADLVTICRTFHWTDQPTVLQRLDHHVAPDGVVAIFGDSSLWTVRTPWTETVRTVVQEFLGENRRAGTGTFTQHDRPYSEIMAASPFSEVREYRVPVTRHWRYETILGYLYSTSFAAPRLFGNRRTEFESTLRDRLAAVSPHDVFVEDNEFVLRIGQRPTA
ncbi:class I SAM-dependent methyltransferase [Haloechinothrix sp. YIM 98757]|uniref:Class I SAM-dependent methyltransferase n=1 Tax=Haloechinothrix aidingensis TaxID=2752311 RepID=A0A838ADG0_9PSEU|nr:class I SAM-dependent methyltransferase [Haloechinothrix aidingensis]MBA0127241.1 class I SAM-dependent methyltransferase [Haloechinothrix aidingensis]